MRQISLLGDAPAAHYLRPERVYRTGVLSPMVGFNPGQAVQANAAAFTSGHLGSPMTGFWGKLSAWWQGVKARAAAGRAHAMAMIPQATNPVAANDPQIHAPGAATPPVAGIGAMPHSFAGRMAPEPYTAMMVMPHLRNIPGGMVTAAYGQSTSLPPYAAEAAAKSTMMRWRGLRWPWG